MGRSRSRAVADELSVAVAGSPPVDPRQIPGASIREPPDRTLVRSLLLTLHAGESEAIALAVETPESILLIDERRARRAAVRLNIPTVGVLGLLVEAKQRGLIQSAAEQVNSLQTGIAFRVSADIIQNIVIAAAEA